MAVPSPSIKPELVAGGVHRAIYMGSVGASSNAMPADYAVGVVRHRLVSSPYEPVAPGRKVVGPNGMTYTAIDQGVDGDDSLLLVRADATGPEYNIVAGTQVTVLREGDDAGYETEGVAEADFWGGASEVPATGQVHLDLTAFSPALRGSRYFADQLMIWIQPLDQGIADVQPQVIRAEDLVGTPPEYLTLHVTNDADANQWVVWVMAPHSHHR